MQTNQGLNWDELFSQYPELRLKMAKFVHDIKDSITEMQSGLDLLKNYSDDLTAVEKEQTLASIYSATQEIQSLLPGDKL